MTISKPLTCPRCARELRYDASDLRKHPRYRDAHQIGCRVCGELFSVSVERLAPDLWKVQQWAALQRPDGSLAYQPPAGWEAIAAGARTR